jgi:hypothetical protein
VPEFSNFSGPQAFNATELVEPSLHMQAEMIPWKFLHTLKVKSLKIRALENYVTHSLTPSGVNLCHTVKAPNFDRVFMKNIFLLHFFVRWPPLKKIDRACKIKVFVVPKLKFLFRDSLRCKERFSNGVEVTIWAANFDMYK